MLKINMLDVKEKYTTDHLKQIMKILRSPEGCPWDREQTHKSIRNDMLEETYETVDAIDTDDKVAMCEELGDMLLQVIFHSTIAEENGEFTYSDVVDGICRKLILRHPHVFGEGKADTSEQVLDLWDKIKVKEKHQNTVTDTLKSVPRSFPALMRAAKVQKRVKKAGYSLDNPLDDMRMDKAFADLKEAHLAKDSERTNRATAKMLFLLAGLQNFYKNDSEELLSKATNRFIETFEDLEKSGTLNKEKITEKCF